MFCNTYKSTIRKKDTRVLRLTLHVQVVKLFDTGRDGQQEGVRCNR